MRNRETLIELDRLTLGYRGRAVLTDVSLRIRRGELWFFLGPNGEGKTTLLRALMRLGTPMAGQVRLHPDLSSPEAIGFVPQRCDWNPTLPTTVREFVSLGLVHTRLRPEGLLEQALERVGLGDRAAADYWSLSGGQRQRALLARALIRKPKLLILDEPTNGLDPTTEHALMGSIEELNAREELTVVFVTHDLTLAAEHASHVALLHRGEVRAGPRDEILTSVAETFGIPWRGE